MNALVTTDVVSELLYRLKYSMTRETFLRASTPWRKRNTFSFRFPVSGLESLLECAPYVYSSDGATSVCILTTSFYNISAEPITVVLTGINNKGELCCVCVKSNCLTVPDNLGNYHRHYYFPLFNKSFMFDESAILCDFNIFLTDEKFEYFVKILH